MKTNPVYRSVSRVLDEAGVAFSLKRGGRHDKLLFEHRGVAHQVVVPQSPSCGRAPANARAYVRRLLRQRTS